VFTPGGIQANSAFSSPHATVIVSPGSGVAAEMPVTPIVNDTAQTTTNKYKRKQVFWFMIHFNSHVSRFLLL
jgi:hypothetical protein